VTTICYSIRLFYYIYNCENELSTQQFVNIREESVFINSVLVMLIILSISVGYCVSDLFADDYDCVWDIEASCIMVDSADLHYGLLLTGYLPVVVTLSVCFGLMFVMEFGIYIDSNL